MTALNKKAQYLYYTVTFEGNVLKSLLTSKVPIILDTKLSSSALVWLGRDPELVNKEFEEFIEVLLERSEILE